MPAWWRRFPALLALFASAASAQAASRVFEPADIASWESQSFAGETRYEHVDGDDRAAVHATCTNATSSGLFRRNTIDLTQTPVLKWSWRIANTYRNIDETTKAGDDYPARIYVVDEHPVFPWRTRALSYVWSSVMEAGEDWPNSYAEQVHMIAVDSGPQRTGEWVSHRRDLREDFRRYHGRDVESIDALAILSDCDDTGQRTEAWFGQIRLRSR